MTAPYIVAQQESALRQPRKPVEDEDAFAATYFATAVRLAAQGLAPDAETVAAAERYIRSGTPVRRHGHAVEGEAS